jgi:hypothetical protein
VLQKARHSLLFSSGTVLAQTPPFTLPAVLHIATSPVQTKKSRKVITTSGNSCYCVDGMVLKTAVAECEF